MTTIEKQKIAFFEKMTPECRWYSNIHLCYKDTFVQLAKIAGLSYEIVEPAFNYCGEYIPDVCAVFLPNTAYTDGTLDRFYKADAAFHKKYLKRLEDAGYDTLPFITGDYVLFLGCEKYYKLEKTNSIQQEMQEK